MKYLINSKNNQTKKVFCHEKNYFSNFNLMSSLQFLRLKKCSKKYSPKARCDIFLKK